MTFSKRRAAALALAAAVAVPLLVASPASAAPMECHVLLYGPTPSAEVDTDYDGNPEVRVRSIRDVTLCVGADVVLTDAPSFWSEPCGEWGSCTRFFVHYGLSGYAEADVQFCFTLDGSPICDNVRPMRVPVAGVVQPRTMCVGYDLGGQSPCSGQMIAFD